MRSPGYRGCGRVARAPHRIRRRSVLTPSACVAAFEEHRPESPSRHPQRPMGTQITPLRQNDPSGHTPPSLQLTMHERGTSGAVAGPSHRTGAEPNAGQSAGVRQTRLQIPAKSLSGMLWPSPSRRHRVFSLQLVPESGLNAEPRSAPSQREYGGISAGASGRTDDPQEHAATSSNQRASRLGIIARVPSSKM